MEVVRGRGLERYHLSKPRRRGIVSFHDRLFHPARAPDDSATDESAGRGALDVPIGEMMRQIATLVVLPTLAGIVVNERWPGEGYAGSGSIVACRSWPCAICWVIGIIVAQTRAELMQVGVVILVVAAIHNACGLWLGYAHARLLGLTEAECRAIAFEVGMQNGGMGTALAIRVLQSPAAALAPAIFAPWMSVTGALLASYWRAPASRCGYHRQGGWPISR